LGSWIQQLTDSVPGGMVSGQSSRCGAVGLCKGKPLASLVLCRKMERIRLDGRCLLDLQNHFQKT